MIFNYITPLLIYKVLYESYYKDLIEYGLTPDQASRKANIYCVKNTWKFFTYAKFIVTKESNNLLDLKEANEAVS